MDSPFVAKRNTNLMDILLVLPQLSPWALHTLLVVCAKRHLVLFTHSKPDASLVAPEGQSLYYFLGIRAARKAWLILSSWQGWGLCVWHCGLTTATRCLKAGGGGGGGRGLSTSALRWVHRRKLEMAMPHGKLFNSEIREDTQEGSLPPTGLAREESSRVSQDVDILPCC